jgi:methylenetetrahydrofolate--tRNA-(uracil-5-)-methyltransferase
MALAFGPAKPVGLVDPRTGKRPFAVVQLRRENAEGTMFNLVGFQTRLRHGEQERVFRMIPGLAQARFLRYGSMHRNTFIDSPRCLLPTLQARVRLDLLVAGQLTGVEGYVESIGAGMLAGINAARLAKGQEPVVMPDVTMLGGLVRHITQQRGHDPGSEDRSGSCPPSGFQPMNANFGLLPAPLGRLRGTERRQRMGERALAAMRETCKS